MNKQCEEEKYCPKVDCPKVTFEVDQGSAKMRWWIPKLDPSTPGTLKSTSNLSSRTTKTWTRVRDAGCGDVWIGGIWSGGTGYADEKVNVDGDEEVNGDEESISWLPHALVVWESEGSGQREWNGEHVAVEDELEGQQGPKWKVALKRWEEDGME
eukprot:s2713_g8.t1